MSEVTRFRSVRLEDHREFVGDKVIHQIRTMADKLRGSSVTYINATSYGGGVAEMLYSDIPIMRSVGIDACWKVIAGSSQFFEVTKKFHNGLQGMSLELNDEMAETYIAYNKMNAETLAPYTDYVVVHDPQPAALIAFVPRRAGRWIWRCNIDLSTPQPKYWSFISRYLALYHTRVFSLESYAKMASEIGPYAVIPPAIDPLSEKNKPLTDDEVHNVISRFGIDPYRPIITQVSRFDPWKDPIGVIDVYRLVKKKVPSVQLVMVGSMATDDPEGPTYYDLTLRRADKDPDIHFCTGIRGVSDIEVNAIQRASDVVLQKSLREGFGLTVTEALWKGKPVVGGNVGGIPLQVEDGKSGFLVETVKEAAEKTVYLLRHPRRAEEMGKEGREHVRKNFLITRKLKDYLRLFLELAWVDLWHGLAC
ncbi:MAG: glycosyltransferase [Candidatus Bathyarchaeia archaeon]